MVVVTAVGLIAVAVIIGVVVLASGSSRKTSVATPAAAAKGPGGSFTKGTGPVLVEEYADFQCPPCRQLELTTYPAVNELVQQGRITFAFHLFAFLGPESVASANAAVCAGDVGKFWPMHDYLYDHQAAENSGFWTSEQLIAALQAVGGATPATEKCVTKGTYMTWVKQQTDAASARGVTAAPPPVIFVRNQLLTDTSAVGLRGAVGR
jgi:protein-disulfide isomerase